MSLHYTSAASLIWLISIATTPGHANDIRFDQSNPTIMTLNITQIGIGHAIQGLAADTVTAEPTSGASLTGNFDTVSLQQTSIGNSTIALNVDVGLDASSDVSIDISGSGTHNVMLDAVAQELTSIITLDGPGAKSVNTYVDAVGKLVSHDIRLSGSAIELSANQQASADLSVELFSPGSLLVPLPSSVTIKQTGEGSAAHILGNIGTDATLVFDQTGSETNYTLDVTLNPNSSLALNQISDGGVASGLKVVVPIGQTITITQ
jgi:hypothetical protein